MNKHVKLFSTISIAIAVGFFSSFAMSQINIKPIKLKSTQDNQLEFFSDILKKIKNDYVSEKTEKELYEAAADGLLRSLDPHSSYLNKDDFEEIKVQTKGEFGGLGIEITMEHQLVKIVSAIDDTPASRAGVKSGDYISKIDGKTVVGLSIEDVVKKLRGKPKTNVLITILRKNETGPLVKKIRRDIIKVKGVKSSVISDVAYIKINTFFERASREMESEIKKMKSKIGAANFKGLIIDLRNNPGGLLDQAIKISEKFLDKDLDIVSIRGRNKTKTTIYRDDKNENLIKDYPIVVLINSGSASASEIVAGALQDNKRAIIMGEKSFGKGSVQTVIPLSKNNGAIRLTTSLYYTPSGKSIQAHGIEPDIIVSEAKIQKANENLLKNSEADLTGHIEVQIKKEIKNANKNKQIKDDNFELYKSDHQLARAIDLVRGLYLFKKK